VPGFLLLLQGIRAGTAAKGADSRAEANDPLAKTGPKAINAEGYNGGLRLMSKGMGYSIVVCYC